MTDEHKPKRNDNKGVKQLCKEMYFKFKSADEIIERTKVKRSTLESWIYTYRTDSTPTWQSERAADMQKFIRDAVERNSNAAHGVVQLGFRMIQDALVCRAKLKNKEGKLIPLSIKESKQVTDIIFAIDKMMKLAGEQDDPDTPLPVDPDLRNLRPATIEQLRNAIMNDPFIGELIPMKKEKQYEQHEISDIELASTTIKE